jgi:hypothetical protein
VKGNGGFVPPWTGRAHLPGSTPAAESTAESKVAATLAARAALGAAFDNDVKALVSEDAAAAVFAPIRAAVDDAIGYAIAGVLLDKAPAEVTEPEAVAALANLFAKRGPERTNRAIRAGIRAMVTKLSPECVDSNFAQSIEDGLVALDNGEATGWATPAPNKRGRSGIRAFMEHWFSIEVTFQQRKAVPKCSRDHAIGLTADKWRDEERPADAPGPILPWDASFAALQQHFKAGVALDKALALGAIAEAAAEGKKIAAGGEASADFMRRRNEYIAVWGKLPLLLRR